jgi:Tfp pilus assembly protein PilF
MNRSLAALSALALLAGCPAAQVKDDAKSEDPKAREQAQIQYDLGANDQAQGNVRQALNEYQTAISIDPYFYEAENAQGLLYHLSFRQLDESERHYKRALELKPDYSSAKNNLAALYSELGRYDACIALEEEVLKDLQYKNSHLAANNQGWCYFKKGDAARALQLIQETVRANPEFCQGYRNLGLIYAEQGKLDTAQLELERLVKKCPDSPQGYADLGEVMLRQKQPDEARKNFILCRDKAKEGDPLLEDCARKAGGKP